eukprot:TRINITY_DN20223_c0_g1_i2.p1 TRINITY_DN20223_c0_g1~~TRINITY_DN20223_c0_g1_i2.p1  ORF type:complete len:223 (+),score=52.69 TRINITY_DN20223_c0_g1_i2:132-800(+)
MIRRPPRSTLSSSSAASDVYKRQVSTQSTGIFGWMAMRWLFLLLAAHASLQVLANPSPHLQVLPDQVAQAERRLDAAYRAQASAKEASLQVRQMVAKQVSTETALLANEQVKLHIAQRSAARAGALLKGTRSVWSSSVKRKAAEVVSKATAAVRSAREKVSKARLPVEKPIGRVLSAAADLVQRCEMQLAGAKNQSGHGVVTDVDVTNGTDWASHSHREELA